ncbi:hypothetical protein ACHAXS_007274, partial [Conticribra weissflogii]
MAAPASATSMDSSESKQRKSSSGAPITRTPHPSDWDHIKTLVALSFRKDKKRPARCALKFVLMPALLMLYTVGFFVGYEGNDDNTIVVGDYRLFPGQNWSLPSKIKIGAFDSLFLENVTNVLSDEYYYEIIDEVNADETNKLPEKKVLHISNASDSSELIKECQGNIDGDAINEICVYIQSDTSYELFFGGKESSSPTQPSLAGAQYAINSALMNVSGIQEIYLVTAIQQTPQLLTNSTVEPHLAALLVPCCMYVLSALVCSLFLIGPVVYEKINGIAKSYVLVGVRMEIYLLQWLLYYSLNGVILALLMTMVCVFFKLMPMSNFGLVFLSNYFGLVQMFAMLVMSVQVITTEEMTSAMVWVNGLFSMAIGAGITVISSSNSVVLTVLSVFSPYIGMIQYIGIYITYDATGYNTGLHPGKNFVTSGLLGNMLAQIFGIGLWIGIMLICSSTRFINWLASGNEHKDTTQEFQYESTNGSSKFEPLLPGKEVVLSLKGVCHAYHPQMLSCGKGESVEVLKGLDFEVCRGEVFGYLGHNGSGKSTSVEILSSELRLQQGHVSYHFREKKICLDDPETIRKSIGVCPQHNDSLQPDLTCRETLELFARLKGNVAISEGQTIDDAVSDEVDRRLHEVKFTSNDDVDKCVGEYSGGMKRKVLIALALLGDPEVIFLDEPTAGLDPFNRRIIWDIIISAKAGRSIVLTTHFLDEADVLSDRIGILKNGKLITCGSSLFLKHNFGAGYKLSFKSSKPFDVRSIIPTAEKFTAADAIEHKWRLNFGSEMKIPTILRALEDAGSTGVTLEMTTLEEVFLKTGEEDNDHIINNDDGNESYSRQIENENEAEQGINKEELQARIWEKRAETNPLTSSKKFRLIQNFVMTNAIKIKGFVFLNLMMPLVYLVAGLVAMSLIETPPEGELVINPSINVSSPW